MVAKTALLNTLTSPGTACGVSFFTTKYTKNTQSAQRMYGATWSSSVSEIRNDVCVATAHREADGREYHPLSWLAGMRMCGFAREQAYSKIPYSKEGVWEEILRLPCQAALEDGRAGEYSMSLEFLVLFFQEKSTEEIHTDLWGNRLSITDPNAGKITSTYNKLNELVSQTDARNYVTSYKVLQRYDISPENIKSLKYNISYPPTEAMKNIKMYPPNVE